MIQRFIFINLAEKNGYDDMIRYSSIIKAMTRFFLLAAAISGFLATLFGAFGAHALKSVLSSNQLNVYNIGVQYHFYHTLALLAVGIILFNIKNIWINSAGILFIFGIVLFSGSLYLQCAYSIEEIALITPAGGFAFLLGWLLLAFGLVRK